MRIGKVIEEGSATRVGRYGRELGNVIWPTPAVRFVARQEFHPFSGESLIAVSVVAPEVQPRSQSDILFTPKPSRLAPYSLEVHFRKDQHRLCDVFFAKCLVILAAAELEHKVMTREQFYNEVCALPDSVLKKAKPTVIITHGEEKREAGKVF